MKRLYFCRHGLSVLNIQGLWAGQIETPLAPEGIEQAHVAGQAAKDLDINHILSSPFSRAHDTAIIIAEDIGYPAKNIEISELVIERGLGILEGTPWKAELEVEGVEGVEPLEELFERARQAYAHVQSLPQDNILIVSHSGFGRTLRHIIHPEIPLRSPSFKNGTIVQLI